MGFIPVDRKPKERDAVNMGLDRFSLYANLQLQLFFQHYPTAKRFRKAMFKLALKDSIPVDYTKSFQAIYYDLFQLAKKR